MKRGGRLILSIGMGLLGIVIVAFLRFRYIYLTEGELFVAFWPAWLIVAGLFIAAIVLLRGVK